MPMMTHSLPVSFFVSICVPNGECDSLHSLLSASYLFTNNTVWTYLITDTENEILSPNYFSMKIVIIFCKIIYQFCPYLG